MATATRATGSQVLRRGLAAMVGMNRPPLARRRTVEVVLAQTAVELGPREPEALGGHDLVPARLEEHLLDHLPLEGAEIGGRRRRGRARRVEREVLVGDEATFTQDGGPLEHVAQLAHVARPV